MVQVLKKNIYVDIGSNVIMWEWVIISGRKEADDHLSTI